MASSVPQRPLSNNPVNPQSSAPQKPVCSYRKSADQGRICLPRGRLRWWGSAAASCGLGRSARSARRYGERDIDSAPGGGPWLGRPASCLSLLPAAPVPVCPVSPSVRQSVRELSVRPSVTSAEEAERGQGEGQGAALIGQSFQARRTNLQAAVVPSGRDIMNVNNILRK